MLKDRENGIDHRGIPSSLSGSRYTPSLRTRVAIERGMLIERETLYTVVAYECRCRDLLCR